MSRERVRALAGAAAIAWLTVPATAGAREPCTPEEEMACMGNADIDLTSLVELADYQGQEGGLFPGGGNEPTGDHACAGLEAAAQVVPRDAMGNVDMAGGRMVMMSVGMSNTTQEYEAFRNQFENSMEFPARHAQLRAVDGAQGGHDARAWTEMPEAQQTWDDALARLTDPGFGGEPGITPEQVQVLWVKQALAGPQNLGDEIPCGAGPCGEFPGHAIVLQDYLSRIVDEAEARFPNLAIVFLSSRTSAYVLYPNDGMGLLNPEPFAFESAFSVKWLVEDRMGAAGPHVTWGPYIWAHSTCNPDGFRWCCNYTSGDFTHPSNVGRNEVARALMTFFSSAPSAVSWFLADPPEVEECDPGGSEGGESTGGGGADETGSGGGNETSGGMGDATSAGDNGGTTGSGNTAGSGEDGGGSTSGEPAQDDGGESGCGCSSSGRMAWGPWVLGGLLFGLRRRRSERVDGSGVGQHR